MHLLSKVTELALDVLLKLTPDAQQASSQNIENRVTACETSNSLDGDQSDVTLWANASRKMVNQNVTVEVKISISPTCVVPHAADTGRDGDVNCIARLTDDSRGSFCSQEGNSARTRKLEHDLQNLRTEQLYTKVALGFEHLRCGLCGKTSKPTRETKIIEALVRRVTGSKFLTAPELTNETLRKALQYLRENKVRSLAQLGKKLGVPGKPPHDMSGKASASNQPSDTPATSSAKPVQVCSDTVGEKTSFELGQKEPTPDSPDSVLATSPQSNPADSPQGGAKRSENAPPDGKPDWALLKGHLLSVLHEMPVKQLKSALEFLDSVRAHFESRASERLPNAPNPDDLPLFHPSATHRNQFGSGDNHRGQKD